MVKCITDKCDKRAFYGYKYKEFISCAEHRIKPMIDVQKRLCICNKRATFGLVNDKYATCCSKCRTTEMIDLNNSKCVCGKNPNFGLITDKSPTCCSKCKTNEMIDISSKKCKCGKSQPKFGLITDKSPSCCSKCKIDVMVDIITKKCKCGKAQPVFGLFTDKIAICCKECKSDDMISIYEKLCECGVRPTFGLSTNKILTCCAKCKTDDMIDLVHPYCKANEHNILCTQRAIKKYKGYCTHCFTNLFPLDPLTFQINCKTKENTVRDYINTTYEGFQHDKPMWIGNCDCTHRRRVDHRKLYGNTLLCIETDENQHKKYNKEDENARYDDLMMIHGGKFIFIRFNPDKYKENNKTKNPTLATRLTKLKEEIDTQIKRIEKEENKELVEIISLFYDK